MATPHGKTAELIGGPEDGLEVEPELLAASGLKLNIEGHEIPVIFSSTGSLDFEPGDEVEIVFMGVYIREPGPGPAHYRWVPADRS